MYLSLPFDNLNAQLPRKTGVDHACKAIKLTGRERTCNGFSTKAGCISTSLKFCRNEKRDGTDLNQSFNFSVVQRSFLQSSNEHLWYVH